MGLSRGRVVPAEVVKRDVDHEAEGGGQTRFQPSLPTHCRRRRRRCGRSA